LACFGLFCHYEKQSLDPDCRLAPLGRTQFSLRTRLDAVTETSQVGRHPMDATIEHLILSELQEFRTDLRDFRGEVATWRTTNEGNLRVVIESTSKGAGGRKRQRTVLRPWNNVL